MSYNKSQASSSSSSSRSNISYMSNIGNINDIVGSSCVKRSGSFLKNPFAKKFRADDFESQGLDCDFFSIRLLVESIGELSQFFGLTCNSLIKFKDPRLYDCVAVTMDPIQLLALELKLARELQLKLSVPTL
jgi:hypothetical protein